MVGRKFLFAWLVLPCIGLALLFLFASAKTGQGWFQDFSVNMAATFAGVLVAVFYVDEVLERYEKRKWSEVRKIASHELTRFCHRAQHELADFIRRLGLQKTPRQLAPFSLRESDTNRNPFLEWMVGRAQSEFLADVSVDDLRQLAVMVRAFVEELEQLLDLHREQLSPQWTAELMELRSALNHAYESVSRLIAYREHGTPGEEEVDESDLASHSLQWGVIRTNVALVSLTTVLSLAYTLELKTLADA